MKATRRDPLPDYVYNKIDSSLKNRPCINSKVSKNDARFRRDRRTPTSVYTAGAWSAGLILMRVERGFGSFFHDRGMLLMVVLQIYFKYISRKVGRQGYDVLNESTLWWLKHPQTQQNKPTSSASRTNQTTPDSATASAAVAAPD